MQYRHHRGVSAFLSARHQAQRRASSSLAQACLSHHDEITRGGEGAMLQKRLGLMPLTALWRSQSSMVQSAGCAPACGSDADTRLLPTVNTVQPVPCGFPILNKTRFRRQAYTTGRSCKLQARVGVQRPSDTRKRVPLAPCMPAKRPCTKCG